VTAQESNRDHVRLDITVKAAGLVALLAAPLGIGIRWLAFRIGLPHGTSPLTVAAHAPVVILVSTGLLALVPAVGLLGAFAGLDRLMPVRRRKPLDTRRSRRRSVDSVIYLALILAVNLLFPGFPSVAGATLVALATTILARRAFAAEHVTTSDLVPTIVAGLFGMGITFGLLGDVLGVTTSDFQFDSSAHIAIADGRYVDLGSTDGTAYLIDCRKVAQPVIEIAESRVVSRRLVTPDTSALFNGPSLLGIWLGRSMRAPGFHPVC